jgi:hypothetical protein
VLAGVAELPADDQFLACVRRVQPRNGTITIPAGARRALRLDLPAPRSRSSSATTTWSCARTSPFPLDLVRDDGTAPAPGSR